MTETNNFNSRSLHEAINLLRPGTTKEKSKVPPPLPWDHGSFHHVLDERLLASRPIPPRPDSPYVWFDSSMACPDFIFHSRSPDFCLSSCLEHKYAPKSKASNPRLCRLLAIPPSPIIITITPLLFPHDLASSRNNPSGGPECSKHSCAIAPFDTNLDAMSKHNQR